MDKRNYRKKNITDSASHIGTMLSVIFFICGILIGTFSAGLIDDSGSSALYGNISDYISLIESGSYVRADFISALFSAYKYHILVMLLGLSIPGFIIIPFVSGVKGFYLSFSFAAFIKVFNSGGAIVAFGLFGLTALISIPCLFFISTHAFSSSFGLCSCVFGKSRVGAPYCYSNGYFLSCGVCLAVLFISVLIELYVTPWFVSTVSVFL